ncbi:MAG: hypothetical protein CMM58_13575 [Rhodospirillaceae bacterium]|nr:hypothetical protein [Rhodospirillaceae bacterium]|tara:strand:+ start:10781 stop:11320 length:540 start_codon:yes stop_codon:yes gene_type:complete
MSFLQLLGLTEKSTTKPKEEDTSTMQVIISKLSNLPQERARYLAAFAYILGRAAYADSKVNSAETEKMKTIVTGLGHIPTDQADLVVDIVKNQVKLFGGTENFLVSRRFKEISTEEQRFELLDCVFAVSAADQSITVVEEGQARQISKELGLNHEKFIAARSSYVEHIAAVKGLNKYRN